MNHQLLIPRRRSGFSPNLAEWRAAKALMAAGTRNAKLLALGDSTVRGISATSSWPGYLAALLSHGSRSSVCGSTTSDTGLTIGAGWAAANVSIGGLNWETNTAVAPISYTPSNSVNSFDVWYIDFVGAGDFTLDIDGAGTTTITPTGVKGFRRATITTGGAAGTKTLNILRVSGYASIVLITGYDSATKEVSVVNSGVSGYKAANWAQTGDPWLPRQAIVTYAPDLTIIGLTINDWIAATNTTDYTTQMGQIIEACQTTGDVILLTGVPTDPATTSILQQQTYIDINIALGVTYGCDVINMTQRWGSFAAADANGWMLDYAHPTDSGYVNQAGIIYSIVGP